MSRFLKIAFISFLVLYVIPLVLVYFLQRNFLYLPRGDYMPPEAFNMPQVEEVALESSDGTNLTAWWLPPKTPNAPVVMFFHGNGSSVFSNHDIYADLHRAGYGVLGSAYPGYPGSSGKPTQEGILTAVEAQYDWLRAQGISPAQINFYGTSLGSGVAAQLALTRRPARLIMEAPFTSALDMGRASMPIFPVKYFMKDTFRSDLALGELDVPLLWIHGTQDEVVPFSMGQSLYESYQGPKTDLVIEGGLHTNLWGLGAREMVMKTLQASVID